MKDEMICIYVKLTILSMERTERHEKKLDFLFQTHEQTYIYAKFTIFSLRQTDSHEK